MMNSEGTKHIHPNASIASSLSHGCNTLKKLRFNTVQIHSFGLTLGDNPSVREGVPVSLQWRATTSKTMNIDFFEKRKANKPRRVASISPEQRRKGLLQSGKCSKEDIDTAIKIAASVKESRRIEAREHMEALRKRQIEQHEQYVAIASKAKERLTRVRKQRASNIINHRPSVASAPHPLVGPPTVVKRM